MLKRKPSACCVSSLQSATAYVASYVPHQTQLLVHAVDNEREAETRPETARRRPNVLRVTIG